MIRNVIYKQAVSDNRIIISSMPPRALLCRESFIRRGFTDECKEDGYQQFNILIHPGARLMYAKLDKHTHYLLQELQGSDNDGDFSNIISLNTIMYEDELESLYYGLTGKNLELL
jgi:hypothetical protein